MRVCLSVLYIFNSLFLRGRGGGGGRKKRLEERKKDERRKQHGYKVSLCMCKRPALFADQSGGRLEGSTAMFVTDFHTPPTHSTTSSHIRPFPWPPPTLKMPAVASRFVPHLPCCLSLVFFSSLSLSPDPLFDIASEAHQG